MTDFDWRGAALDAERRYIECKRELDEWKQIAEGIVNSVIIEGKDPRYHRHIMSRHRNEWKTLWKNIDRLLDKYEQY